MLDCSDTGFLDFLTALLQIDPDLRPTAQAALAHPWLQTPMPPIDGYTLPPVSEDAGGGGDVQEEEEKEEEGEEGDLAGVVETSSGERA